MAGSRCLLVYQSSDPAVAGRPGRLVHFPSPDRLPDRKQLWFTEELLRGAGLQLEHRAHKLFATRLKQCRVFWALSRQLEGIGDLPPNPLGRNEETPIFDFTEFCTGGQGCPGGSMPALGLLGASARMSQASEPFPAPPCTPKLSPASLCRAEGVPH